MSKNTGLVTFEDRESNYIVDGATGEVTGGERLKRQYIRYDREPSYIKLYLDHLNRFKGLQIGFTPILAELLKHTSYADATEEDGGMILYLNKPLKANIAKKCDVSLSRVDHAVTEFVKKGYMRRLELGMYQFNPFLFGKGEWADIENIRATFDYSTGEAVAEIVKRSDKTY